MACVLKFSLKDADWQAATGSSFEIQVVGSPNPAVLHAAVYTDGKGTTQAVTAAPWKFTVIKGLAALSILAESTIGGNRISVQEVCPGGSTQELDQFTYDPASPADGLEVMGL